MKRITVLILTVISFFAFSQHVNDVNFYQVNDNKKAQEIIERCELSNISADSLIKIIEAQKFAKPDKKGLLRFWNKCIDDSLRPFSVYIPESYSPEKKTPLFVYLHGGVSTPAVTSETSDSLWLAYLHSLPWIDMAEQEGFICLFPEAEYSAMWWDTVGAANILSQVRFMKSHYNIDDNRVFLNGFSDGGSGNYFMAMSHATDFASFNAYNGYPAVGSFRKSTPTYFVNLQNSVMHAINTDIDGLYPAKKMTPMIKLAQDAGANILYRVYTGIGHRMTYIKKELPRAVEFLKLNPRKPFPTKIVIETVSPKQGKFNWLEITATDTLQAKKSWHKEYNMKSVEDRLSFGFIADREYKGEGIRISKVAGGICKDLNLKAGDIFIQLDSMKMNNLNDMVRYKRTAHRGDSVKIIIKRKNKLLTFNTKFPEPEYFDIFKYSKKSGQIRASYLANTFYVETSRIKSFRIYIHPDMVQITQKVKVVLNGKTIFNDFVKPDKSFILSNYFNNKDRTLLYVNALDFNVE